MDRFFDILFSGTSLLFFSPLLIFVVVLLKLTGEGEVFFLQERIGKEGKKFKMFKFVTMQKNSPNIATGTVTIKDDPRILPVGSFLRKTKINELPQLVNIFFGDMSIIGPRPMTDQSFGAYTQNIQNLITKVRPGLSGIGSIIFRREEDLLHGGNASVDFYDSTISPYKGKLEEWFISNKNLYVYFVAIFITAWVVLIPNTKIVWKVFKDLPEPPTDLKQALHYDK